jgi:hypothetical protein
LFRAQAKVFQYFQVPWGDDMVGFVDKDQLESLGVELEEAVFGRDTLQAGHGDVGGARGGQLAQFELDGLVRIGVGAMPGSLLDELSPVGQDKSLGCRVGPRLDSANELGEDDLGRSARFFFSAREGMEGWLYGLAAAGGQRHTQPLVALFKRQ